MNDDDLRKILADEWDKRRSPRISMGERRMELAVAAMRRAFDAGRADAEAEINAKFQLTPL